MNLALEKNFNDTIEKDVTMSKNLGVNIKHMEISKIAVTISSDKCLTSLRGGKGYCFKIGNDIYPINGEESETQKGNKLTLMENMNYNAIKNGNKAEYIAEFDDVPKEKVTLKLQCDILEMNRNYGEDESKLILK